MMIKKRIFCGVLLLLLVLTGCAKQQVAPVKPYPDDTIYDEEGRPLWVPPSQTAPVNLPSPSEITPAQSDGVQPESPPLPAESPPPRIGADTDAGGKQNEQLLLAAASPLAEQAEALLAQGDPDRAMAVAERAIRIHPTDPRLWNLMARIQLERGDGGQAAHLARKSNSLARGDRTLMAENWRLIAAALKQQGKATDAKKAMQKADRLERGMP